MASPERTLCIVKPDAMAKNAGGRILARIEESGLSIVGVRMTRLSRQQAEGFYAVHRDKGFFDELVRFMTSGPVLIAVVEGPEAIARWRALMGPTDSTRAAAGTVRCEFGTDIEKNAVHGSDSPENAAVEIGCFFGSLDLCVPR